MAYTGISIVDYLNSIGQDSSYANRAKLAQQNGISNYTGTSAQNTQLLGILNKPTSTGTTNTPTTPVTTPVVNTSSSTGNTSSNIALAAPIGSGSQANIYNPTTGQTAYQTPGASIPSGWVSSITPSTVSSSGYSTPTTLPDPSTSYYGYGTTKNPRNPTTEGQSLQEEQGISEAAGTSGIVSSSFLTSLQNDPSVVAFYVNALTYGGYTIGDVVNDMKRRELASQGNVQAQNLTIIDPEQTRSQYQTTASGQQSVTTTQTLIPTASLAGMVNPDILKYGANMPDDLFKELVPISDPTSQTYKDAVASVLATYYDVTNDQAKATTEQEKAIADTNYAQFKSDLQTKYGIALSDNANTAWNQIESLDDTASQNGIQGSGMEYNQIEKYLNGVRQKDQQNRDQKLTDQQKEDQAYYTSTASADQIAALTPEQRDAYGLTPSADVIQEFSVATLMAKNPKWTQAMAQAAHDAVIDQYGNYRSTLYQTYYSKLSTSAQTQEATAENTVTQDAANKEAAAYQQYDTTQPLNVQPSTTGGETQPVSNQASSSASSAAANISKSLGSYTYTSNGQTYTATPNANTTDTQKNAVASNPAYTPVGSTSSSNSSTSQPPAQTPASVQSSTYKIVSGDTLSGIAARNNTTVAALAKLNNIADPNKISAGATIKLS